MSNSEPYKALSASFLIIVIFQTLHSLEEFFFELWKYLAPARFLSGLISDNLSFGFAIINTSIVAFALWTYVVPVRQAKTYAVPLMWFWAGLEFLNGSGHLWFGLSSGGYFPGLATAPFLVAISSCLAMQLATNRQPIQ